MVRDFAGHVTAFRKHSPTAAITLKTFPANISDFTSGHPLCYDPADPPVVSKVDVAVLLDINIRVSARKTNRHLKLPSSSSLGMPMGMDPNQMFNMFAYMHQRQHHMMMPPPSSPTFEELPFHSPPSRRKTLPRMPFALTDGVATGVASSPAMHTGLAAIAAGGSTPAPPKSVPAAADADVEVDEPDESEDEADKAAEDEVDSLLADVAGRVFFEYGIGHEVHDSHESVHEGGSERQS